MFCTCVFLSLQVCKPLEQALVVCNRYRACHRSSRVNMHFVLVHFEDENSYDVKRASSVKQVKEDVNHVLTEGETVDVEYSGKYYRATVISVSANKNYLLDEMEGRIGNFNAAGDKENKKCKKQAGASQAKQLLHEIINLSPKEPEDFLVSENEKLRKEVSKLKRKVEDLEKELDKHRELDGHLKKARRLLKGLATCDATKAMPGTSSENGTLPSRSSTPVQDATVPAPSRTLPECAGSRVPCISFTHGQSAVESGSAYTKGLLYSKDSKDFIRKTENVCVSAARGSGASATLALQVEELVPGSDIYVPTGTSSRASLARTSTSLARSLLRQIFKEQYILDCSVKGLPAKGLGKREEARPGLNPRGLAALLTFTRDVAQAMKIDYCERNVLKSLGTLMSEMRNK